MSTHGMGESDYGKALLRLQGCYGLQQQCAEIGIVFLEASHMAGAVSGTASFGGSLTAPIQTCHHEPAGAELCGDLAIFFKEFSHAVQQHANAAWPNRRRKVPDARAQLTLVGCHESKNTK